MSRGRDCLDRCGNPRQGKPWSREEVARLTWYMVNGRSYREAAGALHRSERATAIKAHKLGLSRARQTGLGLGGVS